MQNNKYLESSKLLITIDNKNLPSELKIKENIEIIRKKYFLLENLVQIKENHLNNHKNQNKINLEIEIFSKKNNLSIVAALEWFVILLGNIPIYKKSLSFRKQ